MAKKLAYNSQCKIYYIVKPLACYQFPIDNYFCSIYFGWLSFQRWMSNSSLVLFGNRNAKLVLWWYRSRKMVDRIWLSYYTFSRPCLNRTAGEEQTAPYILWALSCSLSIFLRIRDLFNRSSAAAPPWVFLAETVTLSWNERNILKHLRPSKVQE